MTADERKAKRAARELTRYYANREKFIKRVRAWQLKNIDKVRTYQKRYRESLRQ